MHPYKGLIPLIAVVGFFAFQNSSLAVESHPGLGVEALYSEAVLSYNRKQYNESMKIIDQVLATSPNHSDALELKALMLKTQGDDAKSVGVYQKLVQLKPESERGPYHFELGVIFNRQKKPDLAREHFAKALLLKFNEVPSHLFLGMIQFAAGEYSQAEDHFEAVTRGNLVDMKLVAHYYLGMLNFKTGDGASATHELIAARNIASELKGSKVATDIKAATDKALDPFTQSSWFGNLSMMGQYDNNVAQLPTGLAATATSGKATPKIIATGGFGRMSPALSTVQWVASYRFSYNKNLNAETSQLEYFSNLPSLYINYDPLAATTGGLRIDGTWLFKNEATAGSSMSFRQNALNVDLGPYLRTNLTKRIQLQTDLGYRKQDYKTSDDFDGNVFYGRLTFKGETNSRLINPGLTANYESAKSLVGAIARYNTIGFGLNNVSRLSPKDTLTLSADWLASKYPDAVTVTAIDRSDKNLSARLNWTRALTPKFSVLGDVTWTKNNSTDDTYAYDRLMTAVGIGYSL